MSHFTDVSITLDSSSGKISQSQGVYDNYNTGIKRSKGLNQNLINQHRKNVTMVYLSYWLLILVCVWVCGKRLGVWRLLLAFVKGLLWSMGKLVGLVKGDQNAPGVELNIEGTDL